MRIVRLVQSPAASTPLAIHPCPVPSCCRWRAATVPERADGGVRFRRRPGRTIGERRVLPGLDRHAHESESAR
jgi:hypothetical protein